MAPLDWGLGHATRCIPLIRQLQQNNRLLIGVTPATKTIFDEEFPDVSQVQLPSYNIRYSRIFPLWFRLFLSWPQINRVIRNEKERLKEIISRYKIDVVISDNRFGLHNEQVHSVFITHQLFLKAPFASGLAQKINKRYILNYDEVWVPDFENIYESLSGQLSHGKHFHPRVKYVGPLSRLSKMSAITTQYDYLFLLSGPEPLHSQLATLLTAEANKHPRLKFALASNVINYPSIGNVKIYYHSSPQKLASLISESNIVVCRSGYSSLMDLYVLGKKEIILIPTPGQTEQQYLAQWWNKRFETKIITETEITKMISPGTD